MLRRLTGFGSLALAMSLLAGCGSGPVPVSTSGQSPALQAWAAFPVERVPRPLVLVGPSVVDPRTGFPDGPTKLAYIDGAVDLPSTLPPGPARADGYPVVSATDAARSLTSGSGKGPPSSVRLAVTQVQLGTAVFETDRGRQDLPAWQFWFRGVADPASVLAVAPDGLFQPTGITSPSTILTGARLGADGRTLTVSFVGMAAGAGPCTADYTITTSSSRTAVAIAIHAHPHTSVGSATSVACALIGYPRDATTVLDSPLGARVLIDAVKGAPISVTS